jgi:AcrR family transcriptional regulator
VLRYFSSRDALLLELLARQWREWVEAAARSMPPPGASVPEVAGALAAQAARRPVMCDLISIAPVVLELSADPTDVVRFKTAVTASTQDLARVLALTVAGLDEQQAQLGANSAWVLIAGLWPLSQVRADVSDALARAGVAGAMVDFESALCALSAAVLSSGPMVSG